MKWSEIRREYGERSLDEADLKPSPFDQFSCWFDEVVANEHEDPTAMVLSSVDEEGRPDARVVLLKGVMDNQFVFYTNYLSTKARQIDAHPDVALTFYWPQMARQVRIRGRVSKVAPEISDSYFASRPPLSQLSAQASPQSQVIKSRTLLIDKLNELIKIHGQTPIMRPESWGGYQVAPWAIEFWQGRDNRLHDRFLYTHVDGQWQHHRLAP